MSSVDLPGANLESIYIIPLVGSITLSTSEARFLRCLRASGEFLFADSRWLKSFSRLGIFLVFSCLVTGGTNFFSAFSYG
jgi:hypothetical protein